MKLIRVILLLRDNPDFTPLPTWKFARNNKFKFYNKEILITPENTFITRKFGLSWITLYATYPETILLNIPV